MNQSQEFAHTILIVDDVLDNLRLLSSTLAQAGYQIRCAKDSAIALMEVQNDTPHLILLKIDLLGLNGYEVWGKLKVDRVTKTIPVIFLSEQNNIQDKVKAFHNGGVDFISKPFQVEEILVRVQNQLALQNANAEIKMLNDKLEQCVKERTWELESANRVLQAEILQHYQLEEQLRHDALHDSLTQLPNRNAFMQQIEHSLQKAIAGSAEKFAILFIDLDRFQIIKDSLGHLAGDELLIACARRLTECIPETATLARLGGDEFTILLDGVQEIEDTKAIAQKILTAFALPFNLGSRNLTITVSIGIAIGNGEYRQAIDLLRDADMALYRAKELGKVRYEIFTQQMYLDAMSRLELENELREAIFNGRLTMLYQPIVSLDNWQISGFEALVRWQHPEKGFVCPENFIPLAEETSLIIPLGQWVMAEACAQLKAWQDRFPRAKSLTMSINVTGEQLHDSNFIQIVDRILATTQVNSQCLKLEMTESMLIQDTKQLVQVLEAIKTRQIQLSIDDFGTGYSSLSYLPQFPIDILKIDRSFVNAMNGESENLEVIKAIISLAQALNMQIIAEGIETELQANILKSLNVEFGQGFLFSQPLTVKQAEATIL